MRRSRRWIRRIARSGATLGIGLLLGFLVPTIAHDMSPQAAVTGNVPEAPLARQFINSFIADDKGALDLLHTSAADELRAARFRADYARVDPPVHLGSYVGGGYTVHAYGVHVVRADGTDDTLSWRVFTAGGQVGLILPPGAIEAE